MPYVERDGSSVIIGRFANLQPGLAEEFLASDNIEIFSLDLIDVKEAKRQEFKVETVNRMTAQVPAWNSFSRIEVLLSIANLLDLASMTVAQILAKDILVFARDVAIPKVNAMTTEAEILAIDATLDNPFGDGTLWPTYSLSFTFERCTLARVPTAISRRL